MGRDLIGLEDARRAVLASCTVLETEQVPLADALARTLADDVRAEVAVPPFDNSAMDGFAVRADDTATAGPGSPIRLAIAGESSAGHPAERGPAAGQAIRISTGAMVPDGADAVLRIEEVSERDGAIETELAVEPGRDIRRAGEDIPPGTRLLGRGTPLGPAELGVLASVGLDPVPCIRRPRLAVLSSGDELVGPSDSPGPGQIRDTNRLTVGALARAAGAEVALTGRIGDDPAATKEALGAAVQLDVAVVCGGVSVGRHDHVRPALEDLGAEQRFWGVSLRPGRPTWFGVRHRRDERDALVFGLPGNPVSAMVTFLLFVRPAARALSGVSPEAERLRAVLDDDYDKAPGRAHAVRVSLRRQDDGWHASLTRPEQGSHILTSMLGADGLAILPADSDGVPAGTRVEVEPIDPLRIGSCASR